MSTPAGTQYFIKEILSNPIRLPSGRRVPWSDVGDDTGVLETNDQTLIHELGNAARRQVGGIRAVSASEFEDAKKNSTAEELRKLSLFRANNQFRSPRLVDDGEAVVEVKPLPKPTVSPAGQPIATPASLPIPAPRAKRRSALLKAEETKPE